jgi:hypothetical protein
MRNSLLIIVALCLCRAAFAQPVIVQAEYRFDSLTVSSVDLTDSSQALFDEIVPQSLVTGYHKFWIRFQDEQGSWSLWDADSFLVINYPIGDGLPFEYPDIVGAEFRFDSLAITALDLPDGVLAPLDEIVPQSLATGFHKFRIRFQDEDGFWSLWDADSFLVINYPIGDGLPFEYPDIVGAEFRFDSLAITALDLPDGVLAPLDEIVPQSLATGFHKFRIRFQDEDGFWSLWDADSFLVINYPIGDLTPFQQPHLASAEFYIPPDPGIGNGVIVPLPADGAWDEGFEGAEQLFTGLDSGYHKFCVRFQDEDGFWSPTYCDSVYKGFFLTILRLGSDIRLIWKCDSAATDFRVYRSSLLESGFTEIALTDSFRYSDSGAADSVFTKKFYQVGGEWPVDSLFEAAASGVVHPIPSARKIE